VLLSCQHGMILLLTATWAVAVCVLRSLCYSQAVTVRRLLSGCYFQAVTFRLSCQAVTVRLYGLHGVSLSALPALFPCLFITMDEAVVTWSICCILQAFYYSPCLSSHWYANSTVVTVTPPIVAAVTASVTSLDSCCARYAGV